MSAQHSISRFVICANEETESPDFFCIDDSPTASCSYCVKSSFTNAEHFFSLDSAQSTLGQFQQVGAGYFGGDSNAEDLVDFFKVAKVRKVQISISFED